MSEAATENEKDSKKDIADENEKHSITLGPLT
jgi:hypothetical protein